MSLPVLMPAFGESISQGTLTRWLKQPGDQVAVGEALAEVSTDVFDAMIASPTEGVLLEILVPQDQVAFVGAALAVLGSADEMLLDDNDQASGPESAPIPKSSQPQVEQPQAGADSELPATAAEPDTDQPNTSAGPDFALPATPATGLTPASEQLQAGADSGPPATPATGLTPANELGQQPEALAVPESNQPQAGADSEPPAEPDTDLPNTPAGPDFAPPATPAEPDTDLPNTSAGSDFALPATPAEPDTDLPNTPAGPDFAPPATPAEPDTDQPNTSAGSDFALPATPATGLTPASEPLQAGADSGPPATPATGLTPDNEPDQQPAPPLVPESNQPQVAPPQTEADADPPQAGADSEPPATPATGLTPANEPDQQPEALPVPESNQPQVAGNAEPPATPADPDFAPPVIPAPGFLGARQVAKVPKLPPMPPVPEPQLPVAELPQWPVLPDSFEPPAAEPPAALTDLFAPLTMASAPPTTVSAPPAERPASGEVDGRYVSPLVRKLASNLGVDLAKVTGTGVGGRIRREDVEAAKPPPAPLAGLTGMTSAPDEAAQRLAYLSAKAADLPTEISSGTTTSLTQRTAVAEVDLTNAVQLIDQFAQPFAAREGAALTIEAFLIKATSEALKVHGQFNAAIENSTPTYFKKQNIGLAINSAGGQVVAVIHDAAGMGITNLAVAIARLRERAEAGGLVTDDLMGGSFTVTNPGGTGVLLSCPQVQSPQVAVLSVGDVSKRPVVVGDGVAVRSMAYLCLSYDSRLLDGADAARFLSTFKRRIETASHQSEISHGNEDR